jgi:hypothetical protein
VLRDRSSGGGGSRDGGYRRGVGLQLSCMLLPKLLVDMGNLVSGTKITMESPHRAGFRPTSGPMWAKAATRVT